MDQPTEMTPCRKHLFLDDAVVEEIRDLKHTMHQPEKRGTVLKADRPSDGANACAVSAPMWIPDEGVYKLAYETRYEHLEVKKGMALAISTDGLHWEKPELGLVEFEGSKRNNLFPTPDGARLWNVVYDPDDPDSSRRYKGFLTARGGRVPVVSPDCLHWQELDVPVLPSGDAGTLTYDRDNRQFLGLLKTKSRHGRAYNLTISGDFEHWSEPYFFFGTDDEDQEHAREVIRHRLADPRLAKPLFVDPDPALGWRPPDGPDREWPKHPVWRAECYNLGLFPYEGLHLALLMIFYPTGQALPEGQNTDGFHLIQLAMTRDLKTWNRLGGRQPFIGPSPLTEGLVGNYDRLQLQPTNQPVVRGDELWFYYEGMKRRVPQHDRYTDGSPRSPGTLSPSERADWLEDTHAAICLSVLRRDGFVSLDADEKGGELVTKPLVLAGGRLLLNADCAAQGQVRVEIQEPDGSPIEGRTLNDSVPVRGDGVEREARWETGPGLAGLTGRPVRLKIQLRSAQLYGFWCRDLPD